MYFNLTLLGLALFTFLYHIMTFSVGKARSKAFNKEFMSQFNTEHQAAFGTDAPVLGHPDDGNGYYAQKLGYAEWYEFNNWSRAHMNFLETIAPVMTMVFITALRQPLWACISIYTMVFGRLIYALGYCKAGPKGRVLGAIIVDLGLLSVFVGGFWSIFTDPAKAATA